jgi:F-type H+-transporting ATPase subunit b
MPQLEVATYASQIFWLLVAFATLYWLLSTRALPRVGEILEARQDRVAVDLDQAQRLRAEAETALDSYERQLNAARDQAHRTVAESQAKLQAETARRQAAVDEELGRQIVEAQQRIRSARDAAMEELEAGAASAAQAAVERLAGIEVTELAAAAALDAVQRGAA